MTTNLGFLFSVNHFFCNALYWSLLTQSNIKIQHSHLFSIHIEHIIIHMNNIPRMVEIFATFGNNKYNKNPTYRPNVHRRIYEKQEIILCSIVAYSKYLGCGYVELVLNQYNVYVIMIYLGDSPTSWKVPIRNSTTHGVL